MTLDHIEHRVLESASAEAESTLREARSAARQLLDAAGSRNAHRAESALAEARAALQEQHDQELTAAHAAHRLELLARKTQILDEILDAAAQEFRAGRDGACCAWLAAQLEAIAEAEGSLLAAPDDRAAIKDMLTSLQGGGRGRRLALSPESAPLAGGFILQTETADLNLSLDAQLAELRHQLLPELAARAFGTPADPENVT